MTGCRGNTSACDGRDLLPTRLGLAQPTLICGACREVAASMGVLVRTVDRRVTEIRVDVERRRFRPAWLRHLTAREDASWRDAA